MTVNLDNINKDSKIIILGHPSPDVDAIVSGYLLEKLLKQKGFNVEFIIPDKTIDKENLDICNKYGLNPTNYQKELPTDNSKYILVDHNNSSVNGEVICIIDHHPFVEGVDADIIYNEDISSTSCLICNGHEEYFSKEDLQLACVAAMVDTASFNSTKARDIDKEWVKSVCSNYGIDYNDIYKTGLCLTDITDIGNAAKNGLKRYSFDGISIESSYIQVEAKEIIDSNIIRDIINYIKLYVLENDIDYFVFIYHNMTEFKSTAYRIDANEVLPYYYDEYTARGNKIIPDVERDIRKEKIKGYSDN